MSSRLIEVNDQLGKRRARLGTSRPRVIAPSKREDVEKNCTIHISEAKAKRKGWSVKHIDTLIRKIERSIDVSLLLLLAVYILDDGYIFYGLGGYKLIH